MPKGLQHLLNLVHQPTSTWDAERVGAFIDTWRDSGGAESSNSQAFFTQLFDLMGLNFALNTMPGTVRHVAFEAPVYVLGESHPKKIDVYRPGHWLIEAKQGSFAHHATSGHGLRGGKEWRDKMEGAYNQAFRYATHVPEGVPPVLMVVDVGYQFNIWTAFSKRYEGFAARGSFQLEELANPEVYALLYDLLDDPQRRNPASVSAHITRDVAARLAELAKDLEADGHDPEKIAKFLMRCLFTMFAEDVNLLADKAFERLLRDSWLPHPARFKGEVEQLWAAMDTGGALLGVGEVHRFNGALFRDAQALPLTRPQIQQLYDAARADWTHVEPSIFGTLLERALNPRERHRLGAHYTPRAYIERLVRPTVEEPLRAQWELVQAEVKRLTDTDGSAEPSDKVLKEAITRVLDFKKELCSVRVLDPACGSGNFLYVTFDLLKRIEAEVDARLDELGHTQQQLGLGDFSVTPAQFYGIEIKPWAKEIAELVIWIGYLQWWRRQHPDAPPAEPILRDHHNIECRDAVLAYDQKIPLVNDGGEPVTVWDGESMKRHPATGEWVPDESARREVYEYINPRKAQWPEVDYVVGNPPFIGPGRLRDTLGSGYIEALWQAHDDMPQSADYVMFWWNHAAQLLADQKIKRFGFITTNSLTQKFSRRVVQRALEAKSPISLVFGIPDHPWIDSADGAAVRIAMTVADSGVHHGTLSVVTREIPAGSEAVTVEFRTTTGLLNADLTIGADVTQAILLKAHTNLCSRGVSLHGSGFIVSPEKARQLGLGQVEGIENHIRPYRNGRDLTQTPRGVYVIDLFGLTDNEVKEQFPSVYQHIYEYVKPERDQNRRATYRDNWWIFGEPRRNFRPALQEIPRYIATVETSKHRFFVFLDEEILPDNMLVNIALSDAFYLGVLSSRIHVVWALAAGGRLGVGNDPRYNKTRCFDPFPFPDATDEQKEQIRQIGEELDALRKRQQAAHPKLTMTNMYNVLEKLRAGELLDEKEKTINEQGLVTSHLRPLHERLDRAVADAYGWAHDLADEEILKRLVALNHARAEEEAQGLIRWLRPDFQDPDGLARQPVQGEISVVDDSDEDAVVVLESLAWPKDPLERIAALRRVVKETPGLTTPDIQQHFTTGGRKATRDQDITHTLDAMAATGMIVQVEGGRWY